MLINNIKFIAQSTEPNPNEVDYWINTSVDPNGGLIMFHDGEAWHPVNEHHDLFQEELIKEEVERAKAAEAALDQKITTETNRAITKENALETQINEINELLVEEGDGTKFLADDGNYKMLESSTTTTSVTSLPITSNLVLATISAAGSFSLKSTPDAGKEIHVIINNTATSDVTVTLPTSSPYVSISGDSLTVPASGYAEVNAISDGTNIYLRAL